MSLSLGSSSKTTKSNQQANPWAPTIPGLQDLISQISGQSGNTGATDTQNAAFQQLEQNAAAGNPFAGNIGDLASKLFNAPSQSGTVSDAYQTLQNQIGGIAAGNTLNIAENPYLQSLMQQVGNDIQSRVNQQFAGAGRDLSGKNQEAVARGISQGELPTLFNQYNLERQNQTNAANQLFGAGLQTAQGVQGLDTQALNTALAGIPASQAALDASNYAPNQLLQLEQQQKQLPLQDIGSLEALLGPLAQLGGQQTGTSKSSGTSMGLGIQNLFGGLGSLLSDERAKTDKEQVGQLADGTPIYKFRYKADPFGAMHIGLMAQDVEETTPEAVTNVGGTKFVNYDLATRNAARSKGNYNNR